MHDGVVSGEEELGRRGHQTLRDGHAVPAVLHVPGRDGHDRATNRNGIRVAALARGVLGGKRPQRRPGPRAGEVVRLVAAVLNYGPART